MTRDPITPAVIAAAWAVIECCPHRNPDDGCCSHYDNYTPECHQAVCPLVPSGEVPA